MTTRNKSLITFHVGGPDFHPVADQARQIQTWLGDSYEYATYEDKDVFDHLQETDLLVLMGLFYSGSNASRPGSYSPLDPKHESALSAYIASGRPVLLHHGAIASYDDSEVFTRLIGINWVWTGEGRTNHSPIADYRVSAPPSAHAVMDGVRDYTLFDELYYNLHIQRDSSQKPMRGRSSRGSASQWSSPPRAGAARRERENSSISPMATTCAPSSARP